MKLYFDDAVLDGQLQRTVGKSEAQMASIGECLAIAEQIDPDDRESWYEAWSRCARLLAKQGEESAAAGHRVSARGRFLRAAEYFRQAFFFHRDDLDGRKLQLAYGSSVSAFRASMALLDATARVLAGEVSGYLFAPKGVGEPRPTILHIGGYDGTAEELYAAAAPVLQRGFVLAALDGPGQGAMLYRRRVVMRPDWENVLPAMFDAVAGQPEVDPRRIVLVGRSFGGFLAPRGAAGEPRLAAVVADPGQYDLGVTAASRLGPLMDRLGDPGAEPEFDSLLDLPGLRAFLRPRMATHGTPTVQGYFADLMRYTNAESAPRITAPTLVTDNEADPVSTGQGKVLVEHLSCEKDFRLFTRAEGAEGHCEGLAPGVFWEAAFDWIESHLAS